MIVCACVRLSLECSAQAARADPSGSVTVGYGKAVWNRAAVRGPEGGNRLPFGTRIRKRDAHRSVGGEKPRHLRPS